MEPVEKVAVLGAGVIGASWTALFLAAGLEVEVYDPSEDAPERVRDYIDRAWPTLESLGMTTRGNPDQVKFHSRSSAAVTDAGFVQESIPEQLDLKHRLYAAIEAHLPHNAIVASSASGLMVSELQAGWRDPSRFLLGHPFNPPHLIPLVEMVTGEQTGEGVLDAAKTFYQNVGKVTIHIKREVPAHVANRLQAALWREAIHLVQSGVASVEDVDKAVWAGPGLRWAAMGPHMLFHLGAGAGGLQEFCNRYRESFHRWWKDLGDVELTPELARMLSDGVATESNGRSVEDAATERDALIVSMLQATSEIRKRHG